MYEASEGQAIRLLEILAVIAPTLSQTELADIRAFIGAGEFGLAADMIFGAIAEYGIRCDDAMRRRLSAIVHLFNSAGDLDPDIARKVLLRSMRPSPSMS